MPRFFRGSWLLFAAMTIIAAAPGCHQQTPNPPPSVAAPPTTVTSERVVDLGHALSTTDPTWSGKPAFSHTATATIARDTYYGATFSADEHFGTHVDAPAHFAATGWTVDQIPVDRLVLPGVRIDVRAKVGADEDYRVTVDDLTNFERTSGAIPERAIVFIATGWDTRWPEARYMNSRGGAKHFPGLSVEAATYLARTRRVAAIGIDTPSIDHGPSANFEAHRVSMAENVYHIENATGLTALPATGFRVIVAPVKIRGGSGAPTRVYALVK